jgi:hypothetical protein
MTTASSIGHLDIGLIIYRLAVRGRPSEHGNKGNLYTDIFASSLCLFCP